MNNIIIIGSSGHAKVIIDIVEKEGKYNIVGLLDRYRNVDEQTLGYPILGKEEDLPELTVTYSLMGVLVAIGDNYVRSRVTALINELCPDIQFVCAIHPKASIAKEVIVGPGTVIMAGVVINPCSLIGQCCILNTLSSLDHDSIMDDFSSLAPSVTTGGSCQIGECSAISAGTVLINGIQIGEHSVIGAASFVREAIESFVVAYGIPAKPIRARKAGDKYL